MNRIAVMVTAIHNPHDKYFRSAMSDVRVAKEFFEQYLPASILRLVDLDSLQLEKSSFIDQYLKETIGDVLYSVSIKGQKGYLYALVEHQSVPQRWMAFRLWRYIIQVMEEHVYKKKHTVLPIIIPIVFYNGEKKYPYSTDLFALFGEHQALAQSILLQPFHLVDLNEISDEKLKELNWMGIMAFAQKHIFDADFMPYLKELGLLLKRLESVGATEYIITTITYLFNAGFEDKQPMVKLLSEHLSDRIGGQVITLAERLEKKGFEKGILEGKSEGKAEGKAEGKIEGQALAQKMIARNLLTQGIEVSFVAKVTGLPLEIVKTLEIAVN